VTQRRGFPLLVLFNLGDSRGYRWHDGALSQVTHDHSYVQELLDAGQLSPTEAMLSPHRNVVTRALGMDATGTPDTWLVPVVFGDRFVLCSDGLTDEIGDEAIASVLADTPDSETAAAGLVECALDVGGRDNVSVVVVEVVAPAKIDDDEVADDTKPPWGADSTEGQDTVPPDVLLDRA
jgi:protein phosphatase